MNRNTIIYIISVFLFLYHTPELYSRNNETTASQGGPENNQAIQIKKLQDELKNWLNQKKYLIPSMGVGVIGPEGLRWSYYMNSSPTKQYGIASITKTFTATAVMTLVEDGKIELDKPIQDYFPELKIARKDLNSEPVLVRHLLSHSSGLPDSRHFRSNKKSPAPADFPFTVPVQVVPAGYHYRYSNHGFMILGKLVEKISGVSLDQYFKKELFEPMGMDNTTTRHLSGAGGIHTTLPDLARYAATYINRGESTTEVRILQINTVDRMLEEQLFIPAGINRRYVGLGWRTRKDKDGVLTHFHIGGANGIAAWVQIFPRYRVAVVYLGNPPRYVNKLMWNLTSLQSRLAELAGAMSDADIPLQTFHSDLPDSEMLQIFYGRYRDTVSGDTVLIEKNGKENLFLKSRLLGSYSLFPYTTHIFNGGPKYLSHDFVFSRDTGRPLGLATYRGFYRKLD